MSETQYNHSDLMDLVEAYQGILIEEKTVMRRLLNAREATEYEKNRVISIARANGLITGKNEAERSEQMTIVIANTPADESGYHFLREWEFVHENALEIVEARRKALEAEISLTKAWLYSLSGIGK